MKDTAIILYFAGLFVIFGFTLGSAITNNNSVKNHARIEDLDELDEKLEMAQAFLLQIKQQADWKLVIDAAFIMNNENGQMLRALESGLAESKIPFVELLASEELLKHLMFQIRRNTVLARRWGMKANLWAFCLYHRLLKMVPKTAEAYNLLLDKRMAEALQVDYLVPANFYDEHGKSILGVILSTLASAQLGSWRKKVENILKEQFKWLTANQPPSSSSLEFGFHLIESINQNDPLLCDQIIKMISSILSCGKENGWLGLYLSITSLLSDKETTKWAKGLLSQLLQGTALGAFQNNLNIMIHSLKNAVKHGLPQLVPLQSLLEIVKTVQANGLTERLLRELATELEEKLSLSRHQVDEQALQSIGNSTRNRKSPKSVSRLIVIQPYKNFPNSGTSSLSLLTPQLILCPITIDEINQAIVSNDERKLDKVFNMFLNVNKPFSNNAQACKMMAEQIMKLLERMATLTNNKLKPKYSEFIGDLLAALPVNSLLARVLFEYKLPALIGKYFGKPEPLWLVGNIFHNLEDLSYRSPRLFTIITNYIKLSWNLFMTGQIDSSRVKKVHLLVFLTTNFVKYIDSIGGKEAFFQALLRNLDRQDNTLDVDVAISNVLVVSYTIGNRPIPVYKPLTEWALAFINHLLDMNEKQSLERRLSIFTCFMKKISKIYKYGNNFKEKMKALIPFAEKALELTTLIEDLDVQSEFFVQMAEFMKLAGQEELFVKMLHKLPIVTCYYKERLYKVLSMKEGQNLIIIFDLFFKEVRQGQIRHSIVFWMMSQYVGTREFAISLDEFGPGKRFTNEQERDQFLNVIEKHQKWMEESPSRDFIFAPILEFIKRSIAAIELKKLGNIPKTAIGINL